MACIKFVLPVSNDSIFGGPALNTLLQSYCPLAKLKIANNRRIYAVDAIIIFIIIKLELEIRL